MTDDVESADVLPTPMPIPYLIGVPSFSFDGVVISAYDFGESTLPPGAVRGSSDGDQHGWRI